jgi:SAM-dependent methyltransferase
MPTNPINTVMHAMHRPVYESRLRELVRRIVPHLRAGDAVLDVGCGVGTLGKALLDAPDAPEGLGVRGLERIKRGGEPIEVLGYDGGDIPLADGSCDAVILADVLHHEPDFDKLLGECVRVSRRLVIIKDHVIAGPMAQRRIALIDWAANAPYGVPCLYRYNTLNEWRAIHARFGLEPIEELTRMNLYPPIVNLLFGRRLQYFAVLGGAAGMPVGGGRDTPGELSGHADPPTEGA